MSLDVSPDLLAKAQRGPVDDAEFIACIRESLPYAWNLVTELIARLRTEGGEFADNLTPPPDEQARGQLLRMLASDAMRTSIERHFGVALAFQNCHRLAVFAQPGTPAHDAFVTAREQILNQSPELRDC
ncbi:hypothetical protein BTM25_48380 [Actinomadura rubteroloni]|uniref:Uncharacterized protein n=1 Tax=Actinomadura rubteroloni TaxID=1926885 RepID=A0A2P4UF39_9ACTN|nr:SCO5389 family protein [Actinomadura rubteroloni]POM23677.1 hypothetical protein BTM25_48380 [Actinomadura rubteroloni]